MEESDVIESSIYLPPAERRLAQADSNVIASRLIGQLALVRPNRAGDSSVMPKRRCICCGALAHEVAHDS